MILSRNDDMSDEQNEIFPGRTAVRICSCRENMDVMKCLDERMRYLLMRDDDYEGGMITTDEGMRYLQMKLCTLYRFGSQIFFT